MDSNAVQQHRTKATTTEHTEPSKLLEHEQLTSMRANRNEPAHQAADDQSVTTKCRDKSSPLLEAQPRTQPMDPNFVDLPIDLLMRDPHP